MISSLSLHTYLSPCAPLFAYSASKFAFIASSFPQFLSLATHLPALCLVSLFYLPYDLYLPLYIVLCWN
ncbi:hypothetical protein DL93DRAFT_760711 [Clavulina sp. PMI_390]|nr:hypothetical protein DL93DRAFT_760711 [Clavulina sp. PMI_390]